MPELLLLPAPRQMTVGGGTLALRERGLIVLDGPDAGALFFSARRLQVALAENANVRWEIVAGKPLVILPYALDTNDMKFWTDPALSTAQWLQYAIDTFEWLYKEGAHAPRMMSIGLHLRIIGRPGRIGALERFLQETMGR